jgi:transcriptional regulator with XRE-family HTH domain
MDGGGAIRDWRRRRRLTQLDLAMAAGISTRHLSFVETGRARPSRRLLLTLGESLQMPLSARNELLLAAGFAPQYSAHRLDDEPMRPVRAALDAVLAAHAPYPALVLGEGFELVSANVGAGLLIDGVHDSLLAAPLNVMRLCLHPEGLAPRLVNRDEIAESILSRVARSYERSADPQLKELLAELQGYCAPRAERRSGAVPNVFLPFRLRTTDGGELAFVSTLTTFGSPQDVVLESLVLEAFYPGDEATRAALADTASATAGRAAELMARLPHLTGYLAQP